MTKKKLILILVLIILIAVGYFVWTFLRGTLPAVSKPNEDISKVIENIPQNSTDFPLKLLDGFSISIFAKDLGAPRVMAYDPVGNILVSVPSKGKVLALLPDKNGDGMSDETRTCAPRGKPASSATGRSSFTATKSSSASTSPRMSPTPRPTPCSPCIPAGSPRSPASRSATTAST